VVFGLISCERLRLTRHLASFCQGQPFFTWTAAIEKQNVAPLTRIIVHVSHIQEDVWDFFVENTWIDAAQVFCAGEESYLQVSQFTARAGDNFQVKVAVHNGQEETEGDDRSQQPADRNAARLEGNELAVGVHPSDREQNSEEEAHRNGQYDDVWNGDQENHAGVSKRNAADQYLLDEAVDAPHDNEKSVGDESEDRWWHHLADDQPIDNAEELHRVCRPSG